VFFRDRLVWSALIQGCIFRSPRSLPVTSDRKGRKTFPWPSFSQRYLLCADESCSPVCSSSFLSYLSCFFVSSSRPRKCIVPVRADRRLGGRLGRQGHGRFLVFSRGCGFFRPLCERQTPSVEGLSWTLTPFSDESYRSRADSNSSSFFSKVEGSFFARVL